MSIFKLENVCYSYEDGKSVLTNINYEFQRSKIYAITGRSGTGKTTLLSLMSGLDVPKSGIIKYDGSDISKFNKDDYRSHQVGIVFQSFNLLPHLSALENVVLSMDVANIKLNESQKKEKAYLLLEEVGIDSEKANKRILKLSGGEQQRVAIARALSYDPQVILADEPTGNLDRHNEEQILEIFKELAHNKNKCIIIVTHSKNVSNCADEIYNLEEYKKKIRESSKRK